MFTCIICSIFYSKYNYTDFFSSYVCTSSYTLNGQRKNFCKTIICANCAKNEVNLPKPENDWLCSYKCLLNYVYYSDTVEMKDICKSSIPYIHNKQAEKEIKNRHLYTKLVKETLYPNDLVKIIVEYC